MSYIQPVFYDARSPHGYKAPNWLRYLLMAMIIMAVSLPVYFLTKPAEYTLLELECNSQDRVCIYKAHSSAGYMGKNNVLIRKVPIDHKSIRSPKSPSMREQGLYHYISVIEGRNSQDKLYQTQFGFLSSDKDIICSRSTDLSLIAKEAKSIYGFVEGKTQTLKLTCVHDL